MKVEPIKCICDTPAIVLKNTHSNKKNADLVLMKDDDGWAMIVFDCNEVVGVFEVNYCPQCGEKLEIKKQECKFCDEVKLCIGNVCDDCKHIPDTI